MGVKTFAYDDAFSRAIRESYNWTCVNCERVCVKGQAEGRSLGMQCAHVSGRKSMNTRCYPDNAVCLCPSCHAKFTDAPTEWGLFVMKHLGEGRYQMLRERNNDMRLKYSKKDKTEIAAHYRAEYKRLRKLRDQGATGHLALVSYD